MAEMLQYVELQILSLAPILMNIQSVTERWAGSVNIDGKSKKCIKILVVNTEQEHLLGRPTQVILKGIFFFSWRYNPHWGLYFTAL